MNDTRKPGPSGARWVAVALAMVAAVLIGLVQPAGEASAQGTFAGAGFTVASCASSAPDPVCSAAGASVTPTSRDVLVSFSLGTGAGQTFSLVRITSAGGTNNTTTTVTPIVVGTTGFVKDSVPAAAGQVACYQLLVNGGAAKSDFECVVFGQAQGTVPGLMSVALHQTNNLTVTWESVAGAAQYLVYSLGTDGVQIIPATNPLTATLTGNGGLICAVVIPLNQGGTALGSSNLGCGFPNNFVNVGGALPTVPITASIVTSTATRTGTAVVQPTNTNTVVVPTNTSTATNTATITTTPSPADLTISKSGQPTSVGAGGVVTYTLTVGNAGGTLAFPVTVQDNLPPGVTLLSASGTAGFSCGNPAANNVMACSGGSLPGNSTATITLVVLVNSPCVNLSPFVNTAVVNPNLTIPESNFTNNTATTTTSVLGCPAATVTSTVTQTSTVTLTPSITLTPTITLTPVPNFTISKTGPASVNPGDSVTYTITVGNSGSAATGVTVADKLPPQVTFVSASGASGFSCNQAAGVVGCTGGILFTGSSANITIFGVVSGCASPLVNTATVNPGGAIAGNTATSNAVSTTVNGCPTATATPAGPTATLSGTNLSISKVSNPATVNAGDPVSYVITVNNADVNPAPNVQFVDALPAGVTFASVQDNNPSSGTPFSCGPSNGEIVCSGATIPANGSRVVTVSGVTDNPCVVTSPVTNKVTLNPNGYLGNPNPGPTASAQTTINGCAQASATGTATSTKTPTPTVTSTPTTTSTPTITLTPAVNLVITKLDSPDPIQAPGSGPLGDITYTIVVSNTGSVAATNVNVLDTLDNGTNFACSNPPASLQPGGQCNSSDPNPNNAVQFISASGDNGFVCPPPSAGDPSEVGCSGGTIGPNGGATITIVVATLNNCSFILNRAVVNPGVFNSPATGIPEQTSSDNVAYAQTTCVSAGNPSGATATPLTPLTATRTATGTATATGTPITAEGLTFTKVGSPSSVAAGGTINWTLTLANHTANTISGINVTDNVPGTNGFLGSVNMPITTAPTGTDGFSCVDQTPTEPEIVCTGGSIPAGGSATITFAQFVGANATCANTGTNGIFTNTANITQPAVTNSTAVGTSTLIGCNTPTPTRTPTVTNTPGPSVTPTATSSTPTVTPTSCPVNSCADLTISKTPAQTAVDTSGGFADVVHTITVNNTSLVGVAGAVGVFAEDFLPQGAVPVSVSVTQGAGSCGLQQGNFNGPDVVVVCQISSNLTQATPFQFTVTERMVAVQATATNFNTNTNTLGCVTGSLGCLTVNPATPGDHQDIATVDPDNRVHESNEGNNNANATVTVYPYDLNVVVTDAPDPVVSTPACCELTYTVTITNGSAGAQTAFPFWVNGSLALRDPANGSGNIPGDVSTFASIFSVSSSRGATDNCQFQPFASFGIQQYTCTMGSMAPGEVVTLTVLVDAMAPEADGGFDVGIDANLMNRQRPLGGNTIGAQCQSAANAAGGTNPACSAEKAITTGGGTVYTNNPPASIASNDRAIQTTDVD